MYFSLFFIIPLTLFLLILFSGLELAYISANKLSIELGRKKGTLSGKFWSTAPLQFNKLSGSFRFLYLLFFICFIYSINFILTPVWIELQKLLPNLKTEVFTWLQLAANAVICGIILIAVQSFTRPYFRAKNYSLLTNGLLAGIARIFYAIAGNIALFFSKAAHWIMEYIINVKRYEAKEELMAIDAVHFMQFNNTLHEEENSDINKEMFENALSIGDTKLRECLVPRKEIVRVKNSDSIETVKKVFEETKLSKLVVIDQNIDSILGYIHQLDLFKYPANISEIIHPIPVVPESMNATDLMNKFARDRKSMAWVVDEFGGTAGIVTMEDLLEEIFGEIEDEFDLLDQFVEQQISETEYLLSGRLELDHIHNKFHLIFSDETEAETLSGYIIEKNGSIPQQGERIVLDRHEYNILNVNGARIDTVKVRIL